MLCFYFLSAESLLWVLLLLFVVVWMDFIIASQLSF